MRLPGVVIITVACPTNVTATVPSGGRGVGAARTGHGAVPQPLERAGQVAHRQRQRQRAAQALAVLVVELARALGEADAESGGVGRGSCAVVHAGGRPSSGQARFARHVPAWEGIARRERRRSADRPGPGPVVDPVVILGGGLTGISTAAHLRAPWLLFEREERLGGHARTDERDGYRFDKTGHWLHLRDPAIKKLVDELLPGQMVPIARRARIFSHGVLTRYPYQANLYGLPPEVIKECLLGVVEREARGRRRGGRPRTSRTTACGTSARGSRSTS